MKSANTREADRRRLDATLANWMQMMVSITRGVNMIDPKPMTDFSALPCISELEVAQNGIGIPLSVYPPAICSSFGDHLQVVVMNALSFTAQYITFDATGQMVGLAKDLPLSFVAGAVPCAGELVLSGTRFGDDRPLVLGLNEEGVVRWSAEIPITGELSRGPRPL